MKIYAGVKHLVTYVDQLFLINVILMYSAGVAVALQCYLHPLQRNFPFFMENYHQLNSGIVEYSIPRMI